ncbi:3'-hydroxy-N-methyl-(S)-coclaurine 4'-O-methyltransferase-like [Gossypium australe]|uniref:3'-hydroxy-N-methyl-(S)-coclaurine 4'-O-methyltransferase-like n=1 Tax=Gossypium australe TaxID=47621 RepID=A0A5B6UV53_9ROSI|nr:3'-hydroxy-N-methyl-(S)-coclaurine 4'-O-methyltransferase-like [Gossypium australe]
MVELSTSRFGYVFKEMEKIKVIGKEQHDKKNENIDIWNYAFGYAMMVVVKCGVSDVIDNKHGSPMTLSQLIIPLKCESVSSKNTREPDSTTKLPRLRIHSTS